MDSIVTLLIICIVALVGWIVPRQYNTYFYNKYYEKIISMPLAVITAVLLSLWILFIDVTGFWYWAFLVASILFCVISIGYVIYICIDVRTGVFEMIVAVLVQLLAIFGVVILIIGVIAVFMRLFDKKSTGKRKR